MKGDRVEALVDTGQGVQHFEIVATRAGRRIEVTTSRGVVEVAEVTRGGNPVRTGRFMASRLIALVEHPALERSDGRVEVTTRHRMGSGRDERRPDPGRGRSDRRSGGQGEAVPEQLRALAEDEAEEAWPVDVEPGGGRDPDPGKPGT